MPLFIVGEIPKCHRYGATFIPKAKSNSSNRIRAAYSAHGPNVLSKKSPSLSGHGEKSKKQEEHLIVVNHQNNKVSESLHDSSIIFVDGGNEGNPPIKPSILPINNEKNKFVKVLSIAQRDLYAPIDHFHDLMKGLIL